MSATVPSSPGLTTWCSSSSKIGTRAAAISSSTWGRAELREVVRQDRKAHFPAPNLGLAGSPSNAVQHLVGHAHGQCPLMGEGGDA
jgi:hypothetical protein